MMSKLNIGQCGICETPIFEKARGRMVPNQNYSELWIAIDDGSIAPHGICLKDWESLTDEKVMNVFERIKETWMDEMVGWGNDAQFKNVREKTVWAYGLNEQDVFTNIIGYKKLEIKEHKKDKK